jgi:glycine/serine hydroxymethyltransferase
MKDEEMKSVGRLIARALRGREQPPELEKVARDVRELTSGFPLYPSLVARG